MTSHYVSVDRETLLPSDFIRQDLQDLQDCFVLLFRQVPEETVKAKSGIAEKGAKEGYTN